MCLKCELASTVLAKVELPEHVKGALSHRWHHAGSCDGLRGPVAHCQHTHTEVHPIQTHLDSGQYTTCINIYKRTHVHIQYRLATCTYKAFVFHTSGTKRMQKNSHVHETRAGKSTHVSCAFALRLCFVCSAFTFSDVPGLLLLLCEFSV